MVKNSKPSTTLTFEEISSKDECLALFLSTTFSKVLVLVLGLYCGDHRFVLGVVFSIMFDLFFFFIFVAAPGGVQGYVFIGL